MVSEVIYYYLAKIAGNMKVIYMDIIERRYICNDKYCINYANYVSLFIEEKTENRAWKINWFTVFWGHGSVISRIPVGPF